MPLINKVYQSQKSVITEEGSHIFDQLKQLDFDLQINDFFLYEDMVGKALQIPHLTQAFYLPMDGLQLAIGCSPQYNYRYNIAEFFPNQSEIAQIFGDFNALEKSVSMLIYEVIVPQVFKLNEGISDFFLAIQQDLGKGQGLYFGIGSEGIVNRIQWPDVVTSFFPPLPVESKFSAKFIEKS